MKPHNLLHLAVLAAACVYLLCSAEQATHASVIALEDPLVGEDYVTIPVTITTDGSDQPASLQFDVTYDASNFAVLDVQVGDAAAQAGKSAMFSDSATGTLTVLVAGLNQNVITDGVVANVSLCPLGRAADTQTLFLDGVVVSDPFGNPIDIFYERPPEPEGIQLADDAGDETRFPSEYAMEGEQTETLSANSAAMGSVEGTQSEHTAASENAARTTTERPSSFSQRPGYGRGTLIGSAGRESGRATGSAPGDATRQYGSQAYPGVPGDQQYLQYGSQQVPLDRTSRGSSSVTSDATDGRSINTATASSGNQPEATAHSYSATTDPLSRRAVTGYAIALLIVAGAVVGRILLLR